MFNKKILFLIAFLEGFCVILIELSSGKIVAPVFGTTLQVWAGVLGITLFGLASGYLLGSRLNFNNRNSLIFIIGGAAVYLSIVTSYIESLLVYFSALGYEIGLILSLLLILFVPLTLLGAVSPFLSDCLSTLIKKTGRSAGIIFSISTFGGIAGAFTTGFYLIPVFGILITLYLSASVLLFSVLVIFISQKLKSAISITGIALLISIYFIYQKDGNTPINQYSGVDLQYNDSNMMSQLRVLDIPTTQNNGDKVTFRIMLVNNTLQSIVDARNPSVDYLQFSRLMDPLVREYFNNKKVLILGLGGGVIANQFINSNCDVDVIEIDPRIEKIATNLFNLDYRVKVIIEDARRYIKNSKKKYDLIFVDTFHGESIPSHIFTREALSEMKKILDTNGVLISNFHGFTDEERGAGTAAVLKTLRNVGFKTKLLTSNINPDQMRSILFFSTFKDIELYSSMNQLEVKNLNYKSGVDGVLKNYLINTTTISTLNAAVLTDDKQQLEYLLREVSLEWRMYCYEKFIKMNNQINLPLIN